MTTNNKFEKSFNFATEAEFVREALRFAYKEFGAVVASDRVQVPALPREGAYYAQVTFRTQEQAGEKHILLTCQHYPCGNPDAGGELCQEAEQAGWLCPHMLAAVDLYLQSYKESGSGMISKYAIRNAGAAMQTASAKGLPYGRIRPFDSGEADGYPIVWYPPVTASRMPHNVSGTKQGANVPSEATNAMAGEVIALKRQMAEILAALKPAPPVELTQRQRLLIACNLSPDAFCEFSDDELRAMIAGVQPTTQPPASTKRRKK